VWPELPVHVAVVRRLREDLNAGVALTILTDIGARLRRAERRRVPGLS
jgi:hypothetical protein